MGQHCDLQPFWFTKNLVDVIINILFIIKSVFWVIKKYAKAYKVNNVLDK